MTTQALPHELTAVLHHVELNQAGWWAKTIQRLVLACISASTDACSASQVSERLSQFGVVITSAQLQQQIEALEESGQIVQGVGGLWGVAESYRPTLEALVSEAQTAQAAAQAEFVRCVSEHCPSLDAETAWLDFVEAALIPLVKELGAQVYEILRGSSAPALDSWTGDFLTMYAPAHHQGLCDTVTEFWNLRNPSVRVYVLQNLNAYFCLVASSLTEDDLGALNVAQGAKPEFSVFLDTNFVFSVLGLHENPDNEAAGALLGIASQVSDILVMKLTVLPITLREAKRTLVNQADYLRGTVLTRNIVGPAGAMRLSGVAGKYVEAAMRSAYPLSVDDYFGPYIDNMPILLGAKGISIWGDDPQWYATNQRVVNDICDERERDKQRKVDRPRSYENIEHDVILWNYVKDLRDAVVQSPTTAKWWIATLNYSFIHFDHRKRVNSSHNVPVCIHPTNLLQLLQFWVPRSDQLEQALFGSICFPFIAAQYDREAEDITKRILRALSRFRDTGDLTPTVAIAVLTNEALRHRMSVDNTLQVEDEAVRDTLVEEGERAKARLEQEIAQRDAAIEALQGRQEETATARQAAESELASVRAELAAVQNTVADIVAERERARAEEAQRQENELARRNQAATRVRFVLIMVLAPLAAIGVLVCAAIPIVEAWRPLNPYAVAAGVTGLPLAGHAWWVAVAGDRAPVIATASLFRTYRQFWKWAAGVFAALALSVLGNVIYSELFR